MEVKLGHSLENMMSLIGMGLWVRGGNEEVVHVDDEPSLSDHVSEGVVHKLLECGGGVVKTEEHDGRFEESFVGNEGSFPLVAVLDLNIVIPPMDIKLGEVTSIFQFVYKVRDKRKGVGIMGGMFIEVVVILARAKLAILLFDKEERRCLGRVRRANLPYG